MTENELERDGEGTGNDLGSDSIWGPVVYGKMH